MKFHSPIFTFHHGAAGLVAACVAISPSEAAAQEHDPRYERAYAPFQILIDGRKYRAGFPNSKTRRMLVRDFLKSGLASEVPLGFTDIHHGEKLAAAVATAVEVRKNALATPQEKAACQIIAWEALESYSEGYLYAGNKDLLESLRVSFPNFAGNPVDSDERGRPVELPREYTGTQSRKLSYAIHYFFEPVRLTLEFLADDPGGTVRARDNDYAVAGLYHYTQFDDPDKTALPKELGAFKKFDDTNFTDSGSVAPDANGQASQTAGSLYGSALERWAMATYSLADQLWRAAFTRNVAANPNGSSSDPVEKAEFAEMLALGENTLRANIHAQFLATLPLAASLSEADYRQSRIDQVGSSSEQAVRLLGRIRAQEKPKATALVASWTPEAVQQQASNYQSARNTAANYFNGSTGDPNLPNLVTTLNDDNVVEEKNFDRLNTLRNQYESNLYNLTGLNPTDYGTLLTEASREDFLVALNAKFNDILAAPESAIPPFDGSQMTTAALRLKAAVFEAKRAYNQMKSYPERIRVELERNNEVNAEIRFGNLVLAIMDQAVALASALEITITEGTLNGIGETLNLGKIVEASLVIPRALAASNQQVSINAANSKAAVKNLLIDQLLAFDAIIAAKIQSDVAASEFQSLHTQAKRLLDDNINFQNGTAALWYADPALAFRAERIEEVYRDATQNCRIEAYKLARILEAAWAEKFTNPTRKADGSLGAITGVTNSEDFYEAESVFATANHEHVHSFYKTFSAWNSILGTPTYRGAPDPTLYEVNSTGTPPISLRQDVFHLRDYRLIGGVYTLDTELQRRNIREFRAILRNLAEQDPRNSPVFTQLRIDFPLLWGDSRIIDGQADTIPVVERNPLFWNHRLRRLGFRLVGSNIFPNVSNVTTATFEWYGNLQRIGRTSVSYFNTPEYLDDPDHPQYFPSPARPIPSTRPPFFGGPVKVAFGSYTIVDNPGAPSEQVSGGTLNMKDVNIPLFCDQIVLRIQNGLGLRIEQIDDLEIHMRMEVGGLQVNAGQPDSYALPVIP